jgi:hypothetical protein
MAEGPHVVVPIGARAHRWHTVTPVRIVVVVAHNVTTLTRLLDVIPAFDNDHRVQLVFTVIGADPFTDGLRDSLTETGIITIPWEQATMTHFDLAIAASHHGELADIPAPLAILSHGIGYTKYSPRKPESPKARKPESPKARKPESRSACRRSGCCAMRSRSRAHSSFRMNIRSGS